MTEAFFSIITVTKNNAAGLKLTAKSLFVQQDVPSFEWIVIDGDSNDSTHDIIAQFPELNPNFTSEPDNGIYDAMNKGLKKATGYYVWFLNAGDCLSDAYVLRDIKKEIQAHMAPDFLYGDAREDGFIKRAHSAHRYMWGQITHHQSMLYRLGFLKDMAYDTDYKISADYAFTLHVLAGTEKIHYYPRILCDFSIGGISQTQAALARNENFAIRRDILSMHPLKNKLIYLANQFMFYLKQNWPRLYRKARSFLR